MYPKGYFLARSCCCDWGKTIVEAPLPAWLMVLPDVSSIARGRIKRDNEKLVSKKRSYDTFCTIHVWCGNWHKTANQIAKSWGCCPQTAIRRERENDLIVSFTVKRRCLVLIPKKISKAIMQSSLWWVLVNLCWRRKSLSCLDKAYRNPKMSGNIAEERHQQRSGHCPVGWSLPWHLGLCSITKNCRPQGLTTDG